MPLRRADVQREEVADADASGGGEQPRGHLAHLDAVAEGVVAQDVEGAVGLAALEQHHHRPLVERLGAAAVAEAA